MPVRSTLPGWQHGMDPDFVDCIGPVRKRSAVSAWDNGGTAGYVDTEETVYHVSMTELGYGNNGTVVETSPKADGTINVTGPYPLYDGASNVDKIKYQGTTPRYYWLRSPHPSYCYRVRFVSPSGALNDGSAVSTYGAVAGLNLIA